MGKPSHHNGVTLKRLMDELISVKKRMLPLWFQTLQQATVFQGLRLTVQIRIVELKVHTLAGR